MSLQKKPCRQSEFSDSRWRFSSDECHSGNDLREKKKGWSKRGEGCDKYYACFFDGLNWVLRVLGLALIINTWNLMMETHLLAFNHFRCDKGVGGI